MVVHMDYLDTEPRVIQSHGPVSTAGPGQLVVDPISKHHLYFIQCGNLKEIWSR